MASREVTRPRPDIALITPNRPATLHAPTLDLVEALHHTLDELAGD